MNKFTHILLTLILSFSILLSSTVIAVDDEITSIADTTDKNEDDKKAEDKKEDEKENEDEETVVRKEGQKPIIPEHETAVLIDAYSGNILFGAREDKRMYPASTTKIMTAIVAFEAIERGEASKDDMVEITEAMLADADIDGSNIALKVGEVMSLHNLIKGMLIASGNDAASAIAFHIGGDKTQFVDMMNTKVTELDLSDTHFKNPDGIHDDEHYTTAADMAKISYYAMQKFDFRDIVDCAHIKIPPTNLSPERYYINTNGLLSTMRYLDYAYKGANGIKTGYTGKAGNCLVSSVKRDGMEFIGVLFGGKTVTDSHKDSIQMFDWAFEAHTFNTPVRKGSMICEIKVRQGKGSDSIALSAAADATVIVPKDADLEALEFRPNIPDYIVAPVKADDKIGTVSVMYKGQELASCDLLASTSIERSFFWPVMAVGTFLWENPITKAIIIIVLAVLLAFILLFAVGIYKNVKKARKHKNMRRKNHN